MKRASKKKLPKEKVLEAKGLPYEHLRFLVDNYYMSQEMRKRMDMQKRHAGDKEIDEASAKLFDKIRDSFADIEEEIKGLLGAYAKGNVANWLRAQRGIGPVIAAGLLGHIDITKAPTAGSIWRFAGLDPSCKWEKGKKRPYNAALKQLAWHIGQSFMKLSNDPDCMYGQLYRERKQYEIERNESGGNAELAKSFVTSSADVKAKLKEGKLPASVIDARARRYAVKIFLSHLHYIWFFDHFGRTAPLPYAIEFGSHAHFIQPSDMKLIPGLPWATRVPCRWSEPLPKRVPNA